MADRRSQFLGFAGLCQRLIRLDRRLGSLRSGFAVCLAGPLGVVGLALYLRDLAVFVGVCRVDLAGRTAGRTRFGCTIAAARRPPPAAAGGAPLPPSAPMWSTAAFALLADAM